MVPLILGNPPNEPLYSSCSLWPGWSGLVGDEFPKIRGTLLGGSPEYSIIRIIVFRGLSDTDECADVQDRADSTMLGSVERCLCWFTGQVLLHADESLLPVPQIKQARRVEGVLPSIA